MDAWLQTKDDKRVTFINACTIGRLPENTVVLDDPGVSRRHALIHAHGPSGYWLVDFGSRNGVTLNGRRITEPTRVLNGDKIEIAGQRLVFHESKQKAGAVPGVNTAAWKTTLSLSETFVPVGHGMILLTPDGKVQSISGHAEKWLQHYLGKSTHAAQLLPPELMKWLCEHHDFSTGQKKSSARRADFSVEKNQKRLSVRIADENTGQLLLLLTEQETVFSVPLLTRLGLTEREGEVLHWIAEGKSNPEIAVILGASPRTIGKHVEHIYTKLGVESRTAAMLHVMETLGKI